MTNALNLLEDLPIILNIDEENVQEYIVKAYLALRLKPLSGIKGATDQKLNALANIFYNLYLKKNYTLDTLINTVYNYINATDKCPPNHFFTNDIETFLETYGEQ